jgi:exoribonuclease R
VPSRKLHLAATDSVVERGLELIREEREIPSAFPPEVLAEAQAAVPRLPERDLRDVPFITIDPPGARDLDQALHLEARPGGYRVWYAIADVAALVTPGGAMDTEARFRGLTMYGPDRRTLLYPGVISEGAASLLPDEDRPALVWTIDLDESGVVESTGVERAMVRSRQQLDFPSVQSQLEAGGAPASMKLLAEVGRLRQLAEQGRGAVNLPVPEQLVVKVDGGWGLVYRQPLPVEGWNAQISLLVGMEAARLMVEAGTGLLRTLPPTSAKELSWIRRVAKALDVAWPAGAAYPDVIRSLNPRIPSHAALLAEASSLLSGAGYQVIEPGVTPEQHSAIAALYAHATAPLRRLVDRFVGECCLSISAGREVPEWVAEALPLLPEIMARSESIANGYESACVNLVEAALLSDRVGDVFTGVVVDVDRDAPHGEIQIREPAVHARIEDGDLRLGEEIRVRVAEASVPDRRVRFARA